VPEYLLPPLKRYFPEGTYSILHRHYNRHHIFTLSIFNENVPINTIYSTNTSEQINIKHLWILVHHKTQIQKRIKKIAVVSSPVKGIEWEDPPLACIGLG
jgi:hypothetical protein